MGGVCLRCFAQGSWRQFFDPQNSESRLTISCNITMIFEKVTNKNIPENESHNVALILPLHLYIIQDFSLEQHALGAGHLALTADHRCARHPQCHGQGLERALGPVVVVVAAQAVDVHRDAGALREAVQAVGDHLAAEVADFLAAQAQLGNAERTVGEVDDGA